MAKKKLYKTIVVFEIISEEPIDSGVSLETIAEETNTGSWSGRFIESEFDCTAIKGMEAVKAVKAQGSDVEFFQMDEKGNELE